MIFFFSVAGTVCKLLLRNKIKIYFVWAAYFLFAVVLKDIQYNMFLLYYYYIDVDCLQEKIITICSEFVAAPLSPLQISPLKPIDYINICSFIQHIWMFEDLRIMWIILNEYTTQYRSAKNVDIYK